MEKKSEFKSNVLTIIGIVVYIWLALNMGWLNALLVILIGLGIIGLIFRKKKAKEDSLPRKQDDLALRSQSPEHCFEEAFELASQEIGWSDNDQMKVREALREVMSEGSWKIGKTLAAVWPESFSWPQAQDFLSQSKKTIKAEDYGKLLGSTVSSVAYWLHRDAQIRDLYKSAVNKQNRPFVVITAISEDDINCQRCGRIFTADEFLETPTEPCLEFGCACSLDTYSLREIEKLKAENV